MIIWRDPGEVLPTPGGRAVAIGAFDGVHLGHRAVLHVVHDRAYVLSDAPPPFSPVTAE